MRRFSYLLQNRGFWAVIGVALMLALTLVSARVLKTSLVWASVVLMVGLVVGVGAWVIRRRRARRSSEQIADVLTQMGTRPNKPASDEKKEEIDLLRQRMREAVKKIRTSKLGEVSGSAALYELPWYMVIGNPAAGKSTAIVNSGLRFPFSDKTGNIIQGIGGTRNCDWFFTTDGILLDTAGRYSVYDEDRKEWLGFLGLLRKARPRAPINGIIIAASIAELTQNKPEYVINLAKSLRQRVQELTENLEIFAPVYVVFTKADLISGFVEFFEDSYGEDTNRVWGSTLPYEPTARQEVVAEFDARFEELYEGLRELSLANMAANRGQVLSPGLITFPYEFAAIKPALRAFVATLFEDNPFQFRPVFRGFYFTSAVQEGAAVGLVPEKIAERFALNLNPMNATARVLANHGFFLKDLFSKIIFADRALVRQHTSRRKRRMRMGVFFGSVGLLAMLLGGWTWSYFSNQKLIDNVESDLRHIGRIQAGQIDLSSRLDALVILQDRLDQLQAFGERTPVGLGLGLYQGDRLEKKLREEYFHGVNEVLLKPVVANIEGFLDEVVAQPQLLRSGTTPRPTPPGAAAGAPASAAGVAAGSPYREMSPGNADDAYNALKTYIMLANPAHLDSGHLNDQITRFWRVWVENNRGTMQREAAVRKAERVLGYFLAQAGKPDFPLIENRLTLVDQTRDALRTVVKGLPARERVYAEIKLRASTRFAPVTVARIVGEGNRDLVVGSHVISGTFTREAWESYVRDAIKDAANKELQTSDWVLDRSTRDDLTLEGSPEQIRKLLTAMYKAEYVREWQKFVQGVAIREFGDFDQAAAGMNRLGDPALSPINRLMEALYRETAWDNPSLLNQSMNNARTGVFQWIRNLFNRRSPVSVDMNLSAEARAADLQMGPIGKEFAGVAKLMVTQGGGNDANQLKAYLKLLSRLRTRFNELANAGDIGPGARDIVRKTLDNSGSELAETLRFVDEQMLVGVSDTSRATLRPLLVRPLMQAFAVLLTPAERELNKIWVAQVYEPFQQSLASKYPFTSSSNVEASAQEVARIFGTEGAIAQFADTQLGALVTRRGDTITPRSWADMSIRLDPRFVSDFPRYLAPNGGGAGASTSSATLFQIMPIPTPGLSEYTLEIDGQVLRYRNGAQQWTDFSWPSAAGQPGARITGVTHDGRSVEFVSAPGRSGLERLISSASKLRRDNGSFEMSWPHDGLAVRVNFRIISSPQSDGAGNHREHGLRNLKLPAAIAGA